MSPIPNDTPSSSDLHLAWINSARKEMEVLHARGSSCRPGGALPPAHASETKLRESLVEALPGYEIGETISRGGQGIVLKAVHRATNRETAVKILRSGHLASDHERARFTREVQILAQLKHSHIVTVHDSGTSDGLHYFVMDFIRGWTLDEYVIRNNISVVQRLELFAKICEAVAVAHLRGIIHRDLKPGNIRVDPSGEPHILDFGLAKVGEHDVLTHSSDGVLTTTGQFIGSLPWAAPEQISGSAEGVDLRTDVYALGVMLYQCLTERFPYDVTGSFSDSIRNICHVDPKRPSSQNRALDDDVDQIILKSLRKEPESRYESAGELAREIRRYLAGDPIEAKRDSSWYVLRKAMRRHRVTAGIAGLVALLILTVTISLAFMYKQQRDSTATERELRFAAENAEKAADESRREAARQTLVKSKVNHFFAGEVLASAAPERLGPAATIEQAMSAASDLIDTEFDEDPVVAAEIHYSLGATYFKLGNQQKAEKHYLAAEKLYLQAFGEDHDTTIFARKSLAQLYESTGKFEKSEALFLDCLERLKRLHDPDYIDLHGVESSLGWLYARMGRFDEAEKLCRKAMEDHERILGNDHADTLNAINNYAMILYQTGRSEEALPYVEAELAAARRIHGADNPGTLVSMGNLSQLYADAGRMDEARAMAEECLEGRRKRLGEGHQSTVTQMNNLAALYARSRMNDKSAALLQEARDIGMKNLGRDNPIVISVTSNLANILDRLDRHTEAEPLHREALAAARDYLPEGHPYIGLYLSRLGRCLWHLDRYKEAEPLLREGLEILRKSPGEDVRIKETEEVLDDVTNLLKSSGQ
ncbi:MAG: serine/threonine protein kinase [Planctomycetes bacterium]|nr:serine/threonine protein kinase [Planctomycetota bacterium]